MTALRDELAKEGRRVEEDSLYSSKGHFAAASMWRSFHLWVGGPAAVLAAIAGVSALSQFDNHNVIAGLLAIVVAALTALTTFLNPNEKANVHLRVGNQYNALKNRARIFHQIECQGPQTDAELENELKVLAKERDDLGQSSPQIPKWAFVLARRGIEQGEAHYTADTGGGASPRA